MADYFEDMPLKQPGRWPPQGEWFTLIELGDSKVEKRYNHYPDDFDYRLTLNGKLMGSELQGEDVVRTILSANKALMEKCK